MYERVLVKLITAVRQGKSGDDKLDHFTLKTPTMPSNNMEESM